MNVAILAQALEDAQNKASVGWGKFYDLAAAIQQGDLDAAAQVINGAPAARERAASAYDTGYADGFSDGLSEGRRQGWEDGFRRGAAKSPAVDPTVPASVTVDDLLRALDPSRRDPEGGS